MYSKRQCKNIVEKLSQETGFLFLKNNVLYKRAIRDGYFFEPDNKKININTVKNKEKNEKNGEMYFSISHEYGHALLDFVLKNNITKENVKNIEIDEYTSMLQKYFDNKKIKPTIIDLNNFKKTIEDGFALEEKHRNILLFDDKYYISSANIDLYANNTIEIFANVFAMKEILKLESENNINNEFKIGFTDKLMYATLNINFNKINRQNNELYQQVDIHYKQQKIIKSKQEIQNEINVQVEDFVNFYNDISKDLQNIKSTVINLKQFHPTEQEQFYINNEKQKEQQKKEYALLQIDKLIESDSRTEVINNFEPHKEDNFYKIEQENIYSLANTARANLCNIFSPICEVVIDIDNNTLYCFKEPRHKIITTELEEEVLSDKITMSSIEEEMTKEINNDDHDGR